MLQKLLLFSIGFVLIGCPPPTDENFSSEKQVLKLEITHNEIVYVGQIDQNQKTVTFDSLPYGAEDIHISKMILSPNARSYKAPYEINAKTYYYNIFIGINEIEVRAEDFSTVNYNAILITRKPDYRRSLEILVIRINGTSGSNFAGEISGNNIIFNTPPNPLESIYIQEIRISPNATYAVNRDGNAVHIVVTAQNGLKRIYKLILL